MKLIHLISGPRNISTAMMYAFAHRGDTLVVDEPFYAFYLKGHAALLHPGRSEIIDAQPTNFIEVVESVKKDDGNKQIKFVKNMAHHLKGQDWSFFEKWYNVLLIRDPRLIINSYAKVISDIKLSDIGIKVEYEIFNHLKSVGAAPIVLDSSEVLKHPKRKLKELCALLDIPFYEKMVSWPKGPITADGIWAKYWYKNIHASSGFIPFKENTIKLDPQYKDLHDEALFYYEQLLEASF